VGVFLLRRPGVRHTRAGLVRDRGALVVGLASGYALRQREQGQLFAHRVLGRGAGRVPGEKFEAHYGAVVALLLLLLRDGTGRAGRQQVHHQGDRGR